MNTSTLTRTFITAITWNALFYATYQLCFIIRTVALSSTMHPEDFSTWATLNSTIFLALLWLDPGLRKSIPHYAPHFTASPTSFAIFTITTQLLILIGALPLITYLLWYSTTSPFLIIASSGIYLTEGTLSVVRSLYHSYFHNRFFNQLCITITVSEMIFTILAVSATPSAQLLPAILAIKLIASCSMTFLAVYYWPSKQGLVNNISTLPSLGEFAKHSFIMWNTSVLMSISERNFLLPYITYTLGISTGNIFKVANDGALFFYRLIIKTIGNADSALLSHASLVTQEITIIRQLVQKLSIQIMRLVLPLLVIIMGILLIALYFSYNSIVFHAFLIMAIAYSVETVGLPYERFLELKKDYTLLYTAYVVYIISMLVIFILFNGTWIGFITFLILVHVVRLVLMIIIRYRVYVQYGI